ncbi:hypothetical protein PR202_gb27996 [Eleusine coracana subsp. coracana]|uniref:Uncharacterized protein n=1 Tax=Eleusine coracana subsp. coracana TaxID=191504 RepID=A0AAV5FW58_ELECO|nr:hypothetical protein QOZ80_6AG0546060 [Eleusine coracana subsp. coracana]GJN38915.1 hypothetical protein PR202_gb27996 [Eleusine coracana subsp. coracana]
MRDLARRHGPAMLLRFGEVPALVVSSREAAREVTKTHDTAFASRSQSATMRTFYERGTGMLFVPYGDYWRQLRRIFVTEMLNARRVLSFRPIRGQGVAAMLKACAAAAARSEPIEMRERLAAFVADTTLRALVGDRLKDRDKLVHEADRSIEIATGFNLPDLWPSSWLLHRLSSSVRCVKDLRDTAFHILDDSIKEHLERIENGGSGSEDLLDVLLKIQRGGNLEFPLHTDDIKTVILEIVVAGSETTTTTLEWALVELIRHPKAMERVTAELRRAFAAHGTVSEQALGELPYLHLVIRETLRLHAPVPLLLPRECREPCQVLGYDVPRGTRVLVNAWAMGRDERYWPGDPEEFRPERFQAEGVADVDFKGADFEFLPFGAGRRMCPGIGFGLANVEIALASLLFHFDWEAPAEFDMTEAFGLTARRKSDLPLRPILRVPIPAPEARGA